MELQGVGLGKGGAWTGFIWLRIGTGTERALWMLKWTSGLHKMWGISSCAPVSFSRRTLLHGVMMMMMMMMMIIMMIIIIIIIITIKFTMKPQAVMLVSLRCSPFKSWCLSYCPAVSPTIHHDRQFTTLVANSLTHDHIQTAAKLTILNLLEKFGCHETMRQFSTTNIIILIIVIITEVHTFNPIHFLQIRTTRLP